MDVMTGPDMGRKQSKSEKRRYKAMIRVDDSILDRAKLAASLMGMSLADYATGVLAKASDADIAREARKLADGGNK